MAKEYAVRFYSSTEWKRCREAYKKMMCYICEKCGDIGTEVHHIRSITPYNIDDVEVTLNFENLMCLCHRCHMNEHAKPDDSRRYIIDVDGHR